MKCTIVPVKATHRSLKATTGASSVNNLYQTIKFNALILPDGVKHDVRTHHRRWLMSKYRMLRKESQKQEHFSNHVISGLASYQHTFRPQKLVPASTQQEFAWLTLTQSALLTKHPYVLLCSGCCVRFGREVVAGCHCSGKLSLTVFLNVYATLLCSRCAMLFFSLSFPSQQLSGSSL